MFSDWSIPAPRHTCPCHFSMPSDDRRRPIDQRCAGDQDNCAPTAAEEQIADIAIVLERYGVVGPCRPRHAECLVRQVLDETDLPCANAPNRDTNEADAEADPSHCWDAHTAFYATRIS